MKMLLRYYLMKILIVGGGIGGLALAVFLRQINIEPTIIEKKKNWKKKGFSVGIWNNGLAMLRKLGLEKKVLKKSKIIENYHFATYNGKIIRTLNFNLFLKKYRPADILVNRKDLHNLLHAKCKNIPIKMNLSVSRITQFKDYVEVEFSDHSHGKYDAVIGADGMFSVVRSIIFGEDSIQNTNWKVYLFRVKNKYEIPEDVFQIVGRGKFFSLFHEKNNRLLVALSLRGDRTCEDNPNVRLKTIQKTFNNSSFLPPDILKNLKPSDITTTDISYIKLKQWKKHRVVLLGDAAHGMTPFGGMGVSMALEDAYCLATEIGKIMDPRLIPQSLCNYQRQRIKRVTRVRGYTNTIFKIFTETSPIFCVIRDIIIGMLPTKFFTMYLEYIFKNTTRQNNVK